MTDSFRAIPDQAFGIKPIVRIRDIDAVVDNYLLFKNKAEKTNSICAAVLKAEVHGLQMIDVAPALYNVGARYFFVAELYEAISLREILPQKDAQIYTLAGILSNEEQYFKEYNIIPCVNCLEQLSRWNKFCRDNGKGSVIIHLDTHMNRLGLLDDEIEILSNNYHEYLSDLEVHFYMSHFYDIKGNDFTNCHKQIEILKNYLAKLPKAPITFACTDSVILLDNQQVNFDMIRPGIGLVGGAPNAAHPISPEAKHTIEIYAKISQIKKIPKGQTVGYGGAFVTKRDTKMALVHIGYKDGYLRTLSELDSDPKGVYMCIDGYRTPVMGKISLDASTIDVTDVPADVLANAKYAEVVGPNVDLKVLADKSGCYEILVALGRENKKVNDYTVKEFKRIFG
ncbi:alanine racemase [Desulfosporosinus meridiei]|uniref:Alanine racemase n=1 Tax=Desulfosporosinus meridiei (strain ATCC BAA-275 / DSM 13257 / KCTC 12902 / NCIMB 13706 / S10) TaxID=768704 RepID=J7INI0_DESMD|nr:alanine racemase [Desulfosporosinus meridiei]AFQ43362.1 alanine racemase [Desulfosporosinus meridiei DSM 13257]